MQKKKSSCRPYNFHVCVKFCIYTPEVTSFITNSRTAMVHVDVRYERQLVTKAWFYMIFRRTRKLESFTYCTLIVIALLYVFLSL